MSQTHGLFWPITAATPRRRAWSMLALLGLLVTWAAPRPSEASPIRHRVQAQQIQARRAQMLAAQTVATGSYWDRYFTRALRSHRLDVRGPNALQVLSRATRADGRLPDSAFVDYLRWRRSLNPARFDYFHPQLGPLLEPETIVQVHTPEPGQVHPPTPPVMPPGNPNPEVPEPSSAAIAFLLLAASAWARRRSRSRSAV